MAEIVPYPLHRRVRFIRRQASWYAAQSPRGAERNLARQIEVQRAALLKRGVAPAVVDFECRLLEAAIRVAAVRRGGAA